MPQPFYSIFCLARRGGHKVEDRIATSRDFEVEGIVGCSSYISRVESKLVTSLQPSLYNRAVDILRICNVAHLHDPIHTNE